jgi:hypothetical protein
MNFETKDEITQRTGNSNLLSHHLVDTGKEQFANVLYWLQIPTTETSVFELISN